MKRVCEFYHRPVPVPDYSYIEMSLGSETNSVIKHKAVVYAIGFPPIAAVLLREFGVIPFIAEEWICSICLLAYIVAMGIYHAQSPEADSN